MTATGELSQHTIAGTVLTMPVEIRQAQQHMALFSADADAAQRMIDYSGLQACRYRPNRAMVVLMFVHFVDGDLGEYHEYSANVLVNPPGSTAGGWRALQSAGAFVHHMSVDQEFTLEAGRSIWGYPKVMGDFVIRDGHQFGVDVNIDGQLVVGMEFRPGLAVPSAVTSRPQVHPTYSHRDGVTRQTDGELSISGARYRPGGVRLCLGEHRYANELAALGLSKHAFVSSSARSVRMTFSDAQEIS